MDFYPVPENAFSAAVDLAVVLRGLALKQLLKQQLLRALLLVDETISCSKITPTAVDNIPLFRNKSYPIFYRSAIALTLAPHNSAILAQKIAQLLSSPNQTTNTEPEIRFQAIALTNGWLEFHLGDRGLAMWLDNVPRLFSWERSKRGREKSNLWALQYVHARCCSLLRLGQRERLLEIGELSQIGWQWLAPYPIPWLRSDLEGLRLIAPVERLLIQQLLDIVEAPTSVSTAKLAENLSRAILSFEQNCRIFAVIEQKPQLSQARLGLLALAQFVLRQLLQQGLQIEAPTGF
ncbi:MAG: hypothetical protein HC890_03510 [Chloroflexaceae bacterium]|nr:hypothetical protein [Chloroflexaceae bacterium]